MSERPIWLRLVMAPTESAFDELLRRNDSPDVIVLGEGIAPSDVDRVAMRFPGAIVVAGEDHAGVIRGVIRHRWQTPISYVKLSGDGYFSGLAGNRVVSRQVV